MAKAALWSDGQTLAIECPGCGFDHVMNITADLRPRWRWNGSLDAPTVEPSLLVTWPDLNGGPDNRCHSFIRAGRIQFLGDCTHALAGQTVDLPQVEDG